MATYSPTRPPHTPSADAESFPAGPEATHLGKAIQEAATSIARTGSRDKWLSSSGYAEYQRSSFLNASNIPKKFVSSGFATTLKRLLAVVREQDEDEPKPTRHAARIAWQLISEAEQFLLFSFPKAVVSADEEGGIRFRWRASIPGREVRLYCPPTRSKKAYIYHEAGNDYGSKDVTSGQALAEQLIWLMGSENE